MNRSSFLQMSILTLAQHLQTHFTKTDGPGLEITDLNLPEPELRNLVAGNVDLSVDAIASMLVYFFDMLSKSDGMYGFFLNFRLIL